MILALPILTPSQNEYNAWHWRKRHQWTKGVETVLRSQLNATGWSKPQEPVTMLVVVTRYSAGTLDEGNLVGGAKGLIDALVRLGVLYDDAPRWCTAVYKQEPARRGLGRVRVEVTPL